VALGRVFSEYFGFPCQSSFHQILHHHNHPGQVTIGQSVAAVPSGASSPSCMQTKPECGFDYSPPFVFCSECLQSACRQYTGNRRHRDSFLLAYRLRKYFRLHTHDASVHGNSSTLKHSGPCRIVGGLTPPTSIPLFYIHSFISGSPTLCWALASLQFRNHFYTDGRTPWTSTTAPSTDCICHDCRSSLNS
jgi:hypothetical protein